MRDAPHDAASVPITMGTIITMSCAEGSDAATPPGVPSRNDGA